MATAVEQIQGRELVEMLEYVDSLRLGISETVQTLQGAICGEEEPNGEP